MDYFHVEPASSHDKTVYSTRLPAELYDHIIKGELRSLFIKFDGKNAGILTLDDKEYPFLINDEQSSHECYHQSGNTWTKIGPVKTKIAFNEELNDETKEKIRKKTEQSVEERKIHTSIVLDPETLPTDKRTKSRPHSQKKTVITTTPVVNTAPKPYVARPAPAELELPKLPPKPKPSLTMIRKTAIQVLAAKSYSTEALVKKLAEFQTSTVLDVVHQVALFNKVWKLKPELLNEVDLDWEGYTEEEREAVKMAIKRSQITKQKPEKKEKSPPSEKEKPAKTDEKVEEPTPSVISTSQEETPKASLKVRFKKPTTPPDAAPKVALPEMKPILPPAKGKLDDLKSSGSEKESSPPTPFPPKEKSEDVSPLKPEYSKTETPPKKETSTPTPTPVSSQPPLKKQETTPPKKETSEKPPLVKNGSQTLKETPKKEAAAPSQKKAAPSPSKPKSEAAKPQVEKQPENKSSETDSKSGEIKFKFNIKDIKQDIEKEKKRKGEDNLDSESALKRQKATDGAVEAFPYRSEVKSYEQFLEYKNEYETKYKEYIGIRKQIEDTQAQFSSLGDQWVNAASENDKKALDQTIKNLYKEQYEKVKKLQQRHSKLHLELKEIKQRVKEVEGKYAIHKMDTS